MKADQVLEEIHRIAGVPVRPTPSCDEANHESLVIHVRTGAHPDVSKLTDAITAEADRAMKGNLQ